MRHDTGCSLPHNTTDPCTKLNTLEQHNTLNNTNTRALEQPQPQPPTHNPQPTTANPQPTTANPQNTTHQPTTNNPNPPSRDRATPSAPPWSAASSRWQHPGTSPQRAPGPATCTWRPGGRVGGGCGEGSGVSVLGVDFHHKAQKRSPEAVPSTKQTPNIAPKPAPSAKTLSQPSTHQAAGRLRVCQPLLQLLQLRPGCCRRVVEGLPVIIQGDGGDGPGVGVGVRGLGVGCWGLRG